MSIPDDIEVDESWVDFLDRELAKPYFNKIWTGIDDSNKTTAVFPPQEKIFSVLLTPLSSIRLVLIGQDPYHGDGQAHGLAFSVMPGVKVPPSLRNIYKELHFDLGIDMAKSKDGYLQLWADQGVFLLNTCLTVESGKPSSHVKLGWQTFTDAIIREVSSHTEHVVFLLWGKHAQEKRGLIDTKKHLILETVHPSPLSASKGFFGCKHFSEANAYLVAHGRKPVDWKL